MSSRRATVDLDAELHQALQTKASRLSLSLADLVDEAVRTSLVEDAEDLAAFDERAHEPVLDFEEVLKDLRARGQL